jgi:CCR4-NOT transcription complex subunit 1
LVDGIVQSTVHDNIELGCLIVEKAAMEKSIEEINEQLAESFMARRRHRERGMRWIEVPPYNGSKYPGILPEGLRLRTGYNGQVCVMDKNEKSNPCLDSCVR